MKLNFRETYLLQESYDKATDFFNVDIMDKKTYLEAVEYYEGKITKELFTVNLN